MAEKYPIATGVWSNTGIWNGGTLPGTGDIVHANNRNVTIDQDIDVIMITTSGGATASGGGGFLCSTNVVIDCDILAASTSCLTLSGSNWTIEIRGDTRGGNVGNSRGVLVNNCTGFQLRSIGNVTGGIGIDAYGLGIFNSNGTGVIVGNCFGGSGSTAYGVYSNTAGPKFICSGNIIGGRTSSSYGMNTTGPVEVYGYVSGDIGFGINIVGAATGYVYGDVYGGKGNGIYGVYISAANSALVHYGRSRYGSGTNSFGVRLQGNPSSYYAMSGVFYDNGPSIYYTSNNGTIFVSGVFEYGESGMSPISQTQSFYKLLLTPNSTIKVPEWDGFSNQDFTVNTGGGGGIAKLIGNGGGLIG